MNILKTSVLISAVLASVSLTAACSGDDSSGDDDDDSAGKGGTTGSGGSGATGGSGGTGNTSCTMGGNTKLIPNDTGWVDKTDVCNDVGVQGAWYPYGDQYGNGNGAKKCTLWGNHLPSECAQITTPNPEVMAFPNMNGEMHTAGTAEKILPCNAGSMAVMIPTSGCTKDTAGGNDYASMWGAGIGFDLNAHKGPPDGDGMKETWNPADFGVIGIRFTIVNAPPALRVEFPMKLTDAEAAMDTPPVTAMPATTDDHSAGAPYWMAQRNGDAKYPSSPVMEGVNTVLWTEVQVPKLGVYTFDPARILGIQWHVPTSASMASNYDFTIKDVTFLRTP
jgi:hypothetical protein